MAEEKETIDLPETNKGTNTGKIVMIGIFVLLLIAIGVLFFTPLGASLFGHKESNQQEEKLEESTSIKLDPTKVAFATLPEILLNLRNANGKSSFLKVTFVIQSPNEEVGKKVDKLKPIIIDQFQEYLRGLDVEDLAGSAGIQRIRTELLTRTNMIMAPEKVSDVLVGSLLIQ